MRYFAIEFEIIISYHGVISTNQNLFLYDTYGHIKNFRYGIHKISISLYQGNSQNIHTASCIIRTYCYNTYNIISRNEFIGTGGASEVKSTADGNKTDRAATTSNDKPWYLTASSEEMRWTEFRGSLAKGHEGRPHVRYGVPRQPLISEQLAWGARIRAQDKNTGKV